MGIAASSVEHGRNSNFMPLDPVKRLEMEADWIVHFRKEHPGSGPIASERLETILNQIEAANASQ